MALIKLGAVAAAVSGSIGGTVFARNRGGSYIRNRTPPLNPASPRQVAARSILADLSNRWSTVLTQTQRDAWDNYADNVPLTNRLGEPRNVSGIAMYTRGNSLLQQAGMALADDGPTILTQGPTLTPTLTLAVATQDLTVDALPGIDLDAESIGFGLQMGVPQQGGVSFFKGPFQLADARNLDAAVEVPYTVDPVPFPFVAGQAVFIRSRAVTADGRVGGAVIQRFLAA